MLLLDKDMFIFVNVLTVFSVITAASASTVREPCPPMNECPLNCMYGYATSPEGCEVCECRDKPCSDDGSDCRFPIKFETDEKNCNETGTCDTMVKPGSRPDITCQSFCPFGFVKNSAGCEICKCRQHPCKNPKPKCNVGKSCVPRLENSTGEWTATCSRTCRHVTCPESCEKGYERNENDCQTCKCKKDYCHGVRCPMNQMCVHDPNTRDFYRCVCAKPTCEISCQFGKARDRNGCQICKCAVNPCQFVTCRNDLICVPVQDQVCLEKPCPFKAKCEKLGLH